jgi:hypothetical protein
MFFFFAFVLAVQVVHGMMEKKAATEEEGKKINGNPLLLMCFSFFFLQCLVTRIRLFFIKVADFALVGPAGLLVAVAQLLTATSMV